MPKLPAALCPGWGGVGNGIGDTAVPVPEAGAHGRRVGPGPPSWGPGAGARAEGSSAVSRSLPPEGRSWACALSVAVAALCVRCVCVCLATLLQCLPGLDERSGLHQRTEPGALLERRAPGNALRAWTLAQARVK